MILLIDNYDSFTYNLYQYMGIFEKDIKVVRNDKVTIEEIEQLNPDRIVLSPGPKSPKEAGICIDVVKHFYQKKPILGICLGHQSIGAAFGAEIVHAKELMHGKQSLITQDGRGIFEGIPSPVHVARYHSLAVDERHCRTFLKYWQEQKMEKSWRCSTKEYPLIGIQFHPESIYTDHGKKMIENF
ncbi:MAG: anthranilate synthase component II [Anaerobutyricum soehngenii]